MGRSKRGEVPCSTCIRAACCQNARGSPRSPPGQSSPPPLLSKQKIVLVLLLIWLEIRRCGHSFKIPGLVGIPRRIKIPKVPKGTRHVLFAVLVESSDFYHLLGAKVKAYKVPLLLLFLFHGFPEVEAVVSSPCQWLTEASFTSRHRRKSYEVLPQSHQALQVLCAAGVWVQKRAASCAATQATTGAGQSRLRRPASRVLTGILLLAYVHYYTSSYPPRLGTGVWRRTQHHPPSCHTRPAVSALSWSWARVGR